MKDRTVKRVSATHRMLFRSTGGRLGTTLPGVAAPMLLLTTTGRRTGKPHTVPLLYLTEDDGYVVIASYGGRDYPPAWYLNLRADPRATVQVRRVRMNVMGEETTGKRRIELWRKAVAAYEGYEAYQAKTSRQIPIVLLRPAE